MELFWFFNRKIDWKVGINYRWRNIRVINNTKALCRIKRIQLICISNFKIFKQCIDGISLYSSIIKLLTAWGHKKYSKYKKYLIKIMRIKNKLALKMKIWICKWVKVWAILTTLINRNKKSFCLNFYRTSKNI